jgi:hypothetical protein
MFITRPAGSSDATPHSNAWIAWAAEILALAKLNEI